MKGVLLTLQVYILILIGIVYPEKFVGTELYFLPGACKDLFLFAIFFFSFIGFFTAFTFGLGFYATTVGTCSREYKTHFSKYIFLAAQEMDLTRGQKLIVLTNISCYLAALFFSQSYITLTIYSLSCFFYQRIKNRIVGFRNVLIESGFKQEDFVTIEKI